MATMKAKSSSSSVQDEYLNAILDQALDDFQEQQLQEKVSKVVDNVSDDDTTAIDKEAENAKRLKELLANMEDPKFGHILTSTMTDLSGTEDGKQTVDDMFKSMANSFQTDHTISYLPTNDQDAPGIEVADRQVAAAMQMMGQAQRGMQGLDVNKIEEAGEGMMEAMMAQFEALGEKEDYNVSQVILRFPSPYYSSKMILYAF
jgi:hypothetical protein